MSIKPKIFIASSTEARPIASQIADALAKAGFTPIPWWTAFALGDITLQALKFQAEQCDGAVFVFAEDDQAVIRDRKTAITRDNVIFEYGLFMAKLGGSKAVAILQTKTNNPTDFIGVTHDVFDASFINVDRLVAHFKSALLTPAPATAHDETPIFQDDELSRTLFSNDRFPANWRQRLLYIGVDGAKGWMNVCQSAQYSNSTVGHQTRRAIIDAAHNVGEVNTFISFGPGDGLLARSSHQG